MASRRVALDRVLDQANPLQRAPNVSLWLDKYLPDQSRPDPAMRGHSRESASASDAKATHLARTAALGEAPEYARFYARWERALRERGACIRRATAQGRVAIGVGGESIIETAITLHRTYGVPYLPGSALKGLAAAFAHQQLADAKWHKGNAQTRVEPGEAHRIMFGSTTQAGFLTFHDALYIPGSGVDRRPLQPDVLAVHHPGYYRGENSPPADWDSPVPVPFLTATGSFLVAIEGEQAWVAKAYEILILALAELGIGAKTGSGYGRMRLESVGAGSRAPAVGSAGALPSSADSAPAGQPALPAAGEVFGGRVLAVDRRGVRIQVRSLKPDQVLGVINTELLGGRQLRVGDTVRVEVIGARPASGGLTILDLRLAPKPAG